MNHTCTLVTYYILEDFINEEGVWDMNFLNLVLLGVFGLYVMGSLAVLVYAVWEMYSRFKIDRELLGMKRFWYVYLAVAVFMSWFYVGIVAERYGYISGHRI